MSRRYCLRVRSRERCGGVWVPYDLVGWPQLTGLAEHIPSALSKPGMVNGPIVVSKIQRKRIVPARAKR